MGRWDTGGRGAWGQWRRLSLPLDVTLDTPETFNRWHRPNSMEPVDAAVGVEGLAWVAQRRTVQYIYRFNDLDLGECQLQRHGTDPVAEVWAFEVYKPYRRQGAGKRMYYRLEEVARESGVRHLGLYCRVDNVAGLGFWYSVGFRTVHVTERGEWLEKRIG